MHIQEGKTYLGILKGRSKRLYYAVVVFAVLTLLVNASRNEITPFFVWSMYASPARVTDTFPVYVLEYNDGKTFLAPHTWKDHKRMMFFYTIDQYCVLKDNGNKDPDEEHASHILARLHINNPTFLPSLYPSATDMQAYPAWLKRYMQANMGEHIDSIKVYRKWVQFGNDGKVNVHRNELLFRG